MTKTELIALIAQVIDIPKEDDKIALDSTLSLYEEQTMTSQHQSRYDFINTNKRKNKKGKTKKNWE